jgi:hypothetical protein
VICSKNIAKWFQRFGLFEVNLNTALLDSVIYVFDLKYGLLWIQEHNAVSMQYFDV